MPTHDTNKNLSRYFSDFSTLWNNHLLIWEGLWDEFADVAVGVAVPLHPQPLPSIPIYLHPAADCFVAEAAYSVDDSVFAVLVAAAVLLVAAAVLLVAAAVSVVAAALSDYFAADPCHLA